ncbi:MAG: DUF4870 domain-containing protein [Lutibacter sp.]|uniref:DUF4870 domain-containing protein n=1 Tax=Lutibacter sp. TaxID=1925666 RepID=UPI0017A3DAB2|nr:DUF4870 domain-containing protein [Lutibacter sp.]MBT8316297.1 DUF4870 domain-containing protein [Lutibacter sp.]NNJ57157.1 DUF4870 domain-containing protein [Lutibacter sp.]
MITQNDKNYSSITHLSGFAGWFFPFGNIIAPLVLWTAKKNESAYIDTHGKSAVNFQLSLIVYGFLLAILFVPIAIFTLGLGIIAIIIGIIPAILLKIALIILASMKANSGEYYTYPFTIEFIK